MLDAAAPDADASGDAGSADADGGRCLETPNLRDGGTCTLSICRRGSTVEVSATSPEGWYVGALFWVLTVCDTSFVRSRSPSGSLNTLVYDVPEADWAKLREGDPVFMRYGNSEFSPATPCGRLPRDATACRP